MPGCGCQEMAPAAPAAVLDPGTWSSELENVFSAVTPPWGDGPSSVLVQSIHQGKGILFLLRASFPCSVKWQGWMRPSLSPFQQQRFWTPRKRSFEPAKLAHRNTRPLFYLASFPKHLVPQHLQELTRQKSKERTSGSLWAAGGSDSWALGQQRPQSVCAIGLQILSLWLGNFTSGKLF